MLMVAAGAAYAGALAPQTASAKSRLSTAQAQRLLVTRSARFLENKGQWNPEARYLARISNLDLWFTDRGIRYDHHVQVNGKGSVPHQGVEMTFVGGRAVKPMASGLLRGRTDFLKKGAMARNVASYAQLLSKGVYPGIDVRSYFDDAQPRYDFILAPGAKPSAVRLGFKNDNGLAIKDGRLQIATRLGGFANGKPFAYQTIDGKRVPVSAKWALLDKHTAGFELGAYDASKPLVIDPLVYGSFVGGNSGADEAHAVVADESGGVYVTGVTYSPLYPTSGTYGLNYHGGYGQTREQGGGDAFLFKLQGDAYDLDYSAFIGGSNYDSGQFLRRDIAGNLWLAGVTSSVAVPGVVRDNVQILSNPAQDVLDAPDDGAYRLRLGSSVFDPTTAQIRFDATAADIQTALNNAGIAATVTQLRSAPQQDFVSPATIPFARFAINLGANDANLTVVGEFQRSSLNPNPNPIDVGPGFFNEGLTPNYRLFSPTIIRRYGSIPTGGTFTITIRTTTTTGFTDATTAPISYEARADQIQTAIRAVAADAIVTGGPLSGPNNDDNSQRQINVTFVPPANTTQQMIRTDSSLLFRSTPEGGNLRVERRTVYETNQDTDLFVIRFRINGTGPNSVLPPEDVPGQTLIFGSLDADRFANFDVLRNGNGSVVDFLIAGSSLLPLKNEVKPFPIPANSGSFGFQRVGFLCKFRYTSGAASPFVEQQVSPNVLATASNTDPARDLPYVTTPDRASEVDVRGAVFDSDGNVAMAGTVYLTTNAVTSKTSTLFYTGNNNKSPQTGATYTNIFNYEGFNNGNDARLNDIFVRRVGSVGQTIWSGLLGGTENDEAGGFAIGLDGKLVNTGSCLAVDSLNNVYVTGVSRSFDFERTRGVFGEVPADGDTDVTVTKISADGQSLLYSTNLRGIGSRVPSFATVPFGEGFPNYASNIPAGISIDARGYAYITGNLRAYSVEFPARPTPDPTPIPYTEPVGNSLAGRTASDGGTTQIFLPTGVTGGIPDPTYTSPTGKELSTTEGYLTVLNDTATNVVYATFLGGNLDDYVYAPYVDASNDVWAMGFTDSKRAYSRPVVGGNPNIYRSTSSFPASLISPLAFKQQVDTEGDPSFQQSRVAYGVFSSIPHPTGTYSGPDYITAVYSRDGFVDKFRVDLASVSNLSFNPTSIPGGLGAFTTGTVTLSQGAPSGGGQIVVRITGGTDAATLSATNDSTSTITIPIAAGQTQVSFPVYSKAVPQNTPVTVRATFSGTFKETSFQVVPYLQGIQLSSDTVVGGDPNLLRGTVTLAAPAPAGGAEVAISVVLKNGGGAAPARVVNVPFSVPAGQSSAQFDIDTDGVAANTDVVVNATLLGVTRSAFLTIVPAQLQSITIDPSTIASGGTSTLVVSLNGKAPDGGYTVSLESSDPSVTIPTTVTVPAQQVSSAPVTISTSASTRGTVTITAVRGNIRVQATLLVQSVDVASIVFDPSSVASGGTSTGTITLLTNAPDGGAKVYLTYDSPARVTVTTESGAPLTRDGNGFYIVVPAGTKTVNFKAVAGYVGRARTVTFTAGGKSAALIIQPISYTFTLNPSSVTGGAASTGTITLTTAPTQDLPFHISVTDGPVTPDTSNPVLLAGQTSVSVTLSTGKVTQAITSQILAQFDQDQPTDPDYTGTMKFAASKGATLTIKPVGLVRITPRQRIIRGNGVNSFLNVDVIFGAPLAELPDNGVVTFTVSQPNALQPRPASLTIADLKRQGGVAQFLAYRVSRSQDVTITATYAGTTASTVVTVTR